MFGWEFPPFKSGGLGTACFGLTKSLAKEGVEVIFVIPKAPKKIKGDHVDLLIGNYLGGKFSTIRVDTLLTPYLDAEQYHNARKNAPGGSTYGSNLMEEVRRYADIAEEIAKTHDFDVIHAHDWLSTYAGIRAKEVSGKPLVIQIHATEFDRTGGNPNPVVREIEQMAVNSADIIVPVSNYTRKIICDKYNCDPNKAITVHNGIDFSENQEISFDGVKQDEKVVLYLGRVTIQKGPEFFIDVAKKVLDYDTEVKFIFVGDGDMLPTCIERAASLGITKNIVFAGFLRGKDVDKAYRMSDVYIMPSVSEPFGLTPLEAMRNDVPVIISKTSGVSEVIEHCFKADFWDVDEMANQVLGLLNYSVLKRTMKKYGNDEAHSLSWDGPARKLIEIYKSMVK